MANGLFYDRVMETSTTTGTGTVTLAGAVTGFRTWATVGDANTATYCIEAVDGSGVPTGEWETGIGTYTASGTTLARTVPIAGSAATPVSFSAGTKRVFLVAAQTNFHYAIIEDQKAQNTAGGTFTLGAWRTRDLNTEVTDVHGLVSISSNQMTIVAGLYYVRWTAPVGYNVSYHQSRMQNITDTTTTIVGSSEYVGATGGHSFGGGVFQITASKAFEIQHQCAVTGTTTGFGANANFSTEIYTHVELWRIM